MRYAVLVREIKSEGLVPECSFKGKSPLERVLIVGGSIHESPKKLGILSGYRGNCPAFVGKKPIVDRSWILSRFFDYVYCT